jgi:bacterioferritin-associated ferredoxin
MTKKKGRTGANRDTYSSQLPRLGGWRKRSRNRRRSGQNRDRHIAGSKVSALSLNMLSVLSFLPFLDALYRLSDANRIPADDVIVCRCEEVTAGEIRRSIALRCVGPNQIRSFNRCGMGPCQRRLRGLTVAEIIAHERPVLPEETGYYRIRPPIRPITLGRLARSSPALACCIESHPK